MHMSVFIFSIWRNGEHDDAQCVMLYICKHLTFCHWPNWPRKTFNLIVSYSMCHWPYHLPWVIDTQSHQVHFIRSFVRCKWLLLFCVPLSPSENPQLEIKMRWETTHTTVKMYIREYLYSSRTECISDTKISWLFDSIHSAFFLVLFIFVWISLFSTCQQLRKIHVNLLPLDMQHVST